MGGLVCTVVALHYVPPLGMLRSVAVVGVMGRAYETAHCIHSDT